MSYEENHNCAHCPFAEDGHAQDGPFAGLSACCWACNPLPAEEEITGSIVFAPITKEELDAELFTEDM